MNRRDFLRLGLAGIAGAFFPKAGYELTERLGNDMQIGDLLAKLGEGKTLSRTELQEIRLWGNQTQLNNSFVAGIQNGTAEINTSSVTTKIISTGKDIISGYSVRLKRATNFTLPGGSVVTTIQWVDEDYDDGGFYDPNISTTDITIPRTGIYNVTLGASVAASAANGLFVITTFRGGIAYYPHLKDYLSAGQSYSLSGTDERLYTKGETVTVGGINTGASDGVLNAGYFTMRLIREA